jgi:LmbE family N-acetylglucosaminyl deacetylase
MDAVVEVSAISEGRRRERFLSALAAGDLIDARRVALVVAHPDDEAIGAGAQLTRLHGVTVIHATNGAPRNLRAAVEHGFASPADYAFARARELERVMMLGGVPVADRFCLGLPDQDAASNLPRLARALVRLFDERATEVALTHAYEGGHPDHDAVAFAVHAAAAIRGSQGREIGVVEMPFYHADGEGWSVQRFLPAPGVEEISTPLDESGRRLKEEMLAAHKTQAETLKLFATGAERFRAAPPYAFGVLPNGGMLLYERYDWGMTGSRWLELVGAAAAELGMERLL